MAFAPLRFLHAADARLDQAIGEIPRLPPRLESIVRDATRAAFDRCVTLAIDHEVDFVLLAGNTFVEDDQSLCARLSLLDGLEQLDRSGIGVLILPGPLDPLEAWRRIPDLPENVTLLGSGPKGVVPVKRDDKVVARVGTELFIPARKKARTLRDDLRSASQRAVPFKIAAITAAGEIDDTTLLGDWCPDSQPDGTATAGDQDAGRLAPTQGTSHAASGRRLPVDYVALGGGTDRRTFARRRGIAHDPGPMQGRGPDQSGPRGCTLVTVEQDGTVRCDFLPTASVRWEQFRVGVPAPFDRAELLARCRARLDELRPEPCENAWIFQWILHGGRPAIDALDDESFRRQLRQDLANATAVPSGDDSMHQLVVEADEDSVDASVTDDPLQADFLAALSSCRHRSPELFRACVNELCTTDANWASRLEELLHDLNAHAIGADADQIGQQLFRASSSLGAGR
jgi:exonuclease SbcD